MAQKHIYKRILSSLLLIAMLVSLIPATLMPEGKAAANWDTDGDGTLSFLAIGNSFSVDALEYVWNIATNLGVSKVVLGNLYIGGCTLATHASNATNDSAAYTYYYNDSGSWKKTESYKMSTALSSRSWDYISMQQASPNSGQESTYNNDLTNLVTYVKGKAPNAKLVWHMTWAYQADSTHSGFANYNKNQTQMYNAIVSATQNKIKSNSNFAMVIPNGTNIQNIRSSLIGDVLCRDGYHLNKWFGRYAAGLMVVKQITGMDISSVSYKPANVPDIWKTIAIEAVNNAYSKPYAVTASTHTDVTKDSGYVLFKPQLVKNAYWNSSTTNYSSLDSTSSNANQYYATNPRYTKADLPTGCVITVASGWRYRPEGWRTDTKQDSANRPYRVSTAKVVVTDEWWMYDTANSKNFAYRAFNISKTDSSSLSNVTVATVNANFKIYIPKEYSPSGATLESVTESLNALSTMVPNNVRKKWGSVDDVKAMAGEEYLVVSDKNTTGGTSYGWDPTTPRLFGTFQATEVKVSTINDAERVTGADPSWGISFNYWGGTTKTHAGDPFMVSGNTLIAAFKVLLPVQNLTGDTDGQYQTNEINYNSKGYADSIENSWRLKNSAYYNGLTANSNTTKEWKQQWSRSHIFINYNSDRIHFVWWAQYDDRTGDKANGDKKANTSVRSIFTNPANEEPFFSLGTTEVANTPVNYCCFHLYDIIEEQVNTEPIYNEIIRAKNYLSVDPTYSTGYQNFLTALQDAINKYELYNGQVLSSESVAKDAQNTVKSSLDALTKAITNLDAYNQVTFLAIPYNKVISDIDSKYKNGGLEGTYFISRQYNGNMGGVYSFMNPNDINSGDLAIQRLSVVSSTVQASDLTYATTIRYVEGSTNKYTLQEEGENFYRLSGWSITMGDPYNFILKTAEYGTNYVSIEDPANANRLLYCDAASTTAYDFSIEGESLWEKNKNRVAFRLYQCSPTTLEMYRTLKFILPYLDPNEAVKRYPNELYQNFLTFVSSCCTKYTAYNNNSYFSNTTAKNELEGMAATLLDWVTKLTNADGTASYIEVPMEVLDFRADMLMMEWYSNYYTLANSTYGDLTYPTVPGTSVDPDLTDAYTNKARQGLIQTSLIEGRIVYTPETITYVANVMNSYDDSSTSSAAKTIRDSLSGVYQDDIRAKLDKLKSSGSLGSLSETFEKTTTENNGGILKWNQITTIYDLAYYLLSNMWREVDKTDTLTDGDLYNIRVPERDTLRLYKDSKGMYTITSENNMIYDGYSIYNSYPPMATTVINQTPRFTPIDGLGFEANGAETDRSTYFENQGYEDTIIGTNYHYMIHAYGAFVYYEDQNLKFSFLGDDDVYFFINGKLAMDIGGAHSPVGASLELNTKIADLGLVDGELCTFDMFYIERHTTGANMKLSTNIKIVDTNTLTTKGQYLDTAIDTSMVDATGRGPELTDNALVNIGDIVSYSFNVLNTRNVPLYRISFSDTSIGSYISPEGITLSDPELANGAETTLKDISLYYSTHANGITDSSTPVVKSYSEIVSMINTAKANKTSLPTGTYRVQVASDEELKDLLYLGIPIDCNLSIYGFKRKTVEGDRPYENTIDGVYYYLPDDVNATDDDAREVTGSASRTVQVPDPSTFSLPTADRVQVVLDYGKTIQIPLDILKNHIYVSYQVKVGNYVGLTTSGYNGAPLRRLPTDLTCAASGSGENGNQLYGNNGTFYLTSDNVTYRPEKMMNSMEKVYAVFELSGCMGMTNNGTTSVNYNYVLVEIQVIPGPSVYYETDFASGIFSLKQVENGSVKSEAWSTKEGGKQAQDTVQDYNEVSDAYFRMEINSKDSLYFGFDNQPEDRARYEGYKNGSAAAVNFDLYNDSNKSWWGGLNKVAEGGISIDNVHGVMEILAAETLADDAYPDVFVDTAIAGNRSDLPLGYDGSNAMIYQVRFKLENFRVGQYIKNGSTITTSPYVLLQMMPNNNWQDSYIISRASNQAYYDVKHVNSGEFITMTALINDPVRTSDSINRLRLYFGGIESIEGLQGKVTIDYAYIGPGELAPEPIGYDSSYDDDSLLSNGTSLFTEGKGVKTNDTVKTYTEASFSFIGTGFDLISRTGKEQATLRVTVQDENGVTEKTITINNTGELELYQIPIITLRDLTYGSHTVTIGVYQPIKLTGVAAALNRGGEFYLDAVRIYDPIMTEDTVLTEEEDTILNSYMSIGEAYPYRQDIRDRIITAGVFNELVGAGEGMVFLDMQSLNEDGYVIGNHVSASVATYDKVGPKNEVYLAPKQAIAFRVVPNISANPASIDIGAKTINGTSGTLVAGFVTSGKATTSVLALANRTEHTISSATTQFYSLDESAFSAENVYLVVYNNTATTGSGAADGVISLTEIKVAYDQNPYENGKKSIHPSAPVSFLVDEATLEAAEVFLETPYDLPVEKTDIPLMHSLNLVSDISLNYVIPKSSVAGYENLYLEVEIPKYVGNTLDRWELTTLSPVEKGAYYYFVLEGMTAVNMGDELKAVLKMRKNGQVYVSPTDYYSISDYAYSQLRKDNSPESLKKLCANLLQYGAKAQEYKGYRTDCLANNALTTEQLAYVTDPETVIFGNTSSITNDLSDPAITWVGKTLDLGSRVTVKFVFSAAAYPGAWEDLSLRLNYTTVTGEQKEVLLEYAEVYNAAGKQYAFIFSGLLAAELRSTLTAQVYCGDTPLSCTMTYSADTYGNNKTGTLGELCKAIFAYSDSAKNYFTN